MSGEMRFVYTLYIAYRINTKASAQVHQGPGLHCCTFFKWNLHYDYTCKRPNLGTSFMTGISTKSLSHCWIIDWVNYRDLARGKSMRSSCRLFSTADRLHLDAGRSVSVDQQGRNDGQLVNHPKGLSVRRWRLFVPSWPNWTDQRQNSRSDW